MTQNAIEWISNQKVGLCVCVCVHVYELCVLDEKTLLVHVQNITYQPTLTLSAIRHFQPIRT